MSVKSRGKYEYGFEVNLADLRDVFIQGIVHWDIIAMVPIIISCHLFRDNEQ